VEDVQHDQPTTDVPQHENLVRHPIRATVHEVEHLRDVAAEGNSAATPAIIAAAVIVFITPSPPSSCCSCSPSRPTRIARS
jgi:hypothetical protein